MTFCPVVGLLRPGRIFSPTSLYYLYILIILQLSEVEAQHFNQVGSASALGLRIICEVCLPKLLDSRICISLHTKIIFNGNDRGSFMFVIQL